MPSVPCLFQYLSLIRTTYSTRFQFNQQEKQNVRLNRHSFLCIIDQWCFSFHKKISLYFVCRKIFESTLENNAVDKSCIICPHMFTQALTFYRWKFGLFFFLLKQVYDKNLFIIGLKCKVMLFHHQSIRRDPDTKMYIHNYEIQKKKKVLGDLHICKFLLHVCILTYENTSIKMSYIAYTICIL